VSARAEVIIAGGGIVGLATAYQISMQYPHTKITVLEKESGVGQHQTGRNSGVITHLVHCARSIVTKVAG
jgi:L-2-hydroxyglutarate oxidase